MLVHIPWKDGVFKLRPDQREVVEQDAKGLFVRIRRADTGRLNKCRIVSGTLHDLVGGYVHGTVRKTGKDYVALLVDGIDGFTGSAQTLVSMAKSYMELQKESWHVTTPRSWSMPLPGGVLGPHVSLHDRHEKDVGKRMSLRIVGVFHWEENHRWVALELKGKATDKTNWKLHMSCAQEPM